MDPPCAYAAWMRLRTPSTLERQKAGHPATLTGARHQSGSDDIRYDHGVDAAGVWVIDVPRTVAQQEVGTMFTTPPLLPPIVSWMLSCLTWWSPLLYLTLKPYSRTATFWTVRPKLIVLISFCGDPVTAGNSKCVLAITIAIDESPK
jgi:hypothetical protein